MERILMFDIKAFCEGYLQAICGSVHKIPQPEPEPAEQWEVLYVGSVTTAMDFTGWPHPSGGIKNSYGSALETIVPGDIVRLTVGTDSWVLPIYDGWPSTNGFGDGVWGNSELNGNLPEVTMYTDYDFCFVPYWGHFYSRNAGTYSIKIERLVT